MGFRSIDGGRRAADGERPASGARSILAGLIAVVAVVFTLLATGLLASQDRELVAATRPTVTPTEFPPSATFASPSGAKLPTHQVTPTWTPTPTSMLLSSTEQPSPSPSASPSPSPTPEPTSTPSPSPTPTPSPTPPPAPSPTSEPEQARQSASASEAACTPPESWRKYRVRHTQPVKSLAVFFGISTSELRQANCLTRNTIRAGTVLWVPPREDGPKPPPEPSPTSRPTRRPTATPSPTSTRVPNGGGIVIPPERSGESPFSATNLEVRLLPLIGAAALPVLLAVG